MQIRILIGLMVLVLIGATAWLLSPDKGTSSPPTPVAATPKDHSAGPDGTTRPTNPRPTARNENGDTLANEKKNNQRMIAGQRRAFEVKIETLIAKYQLDAAQAEALREFFDEQLDRMQDLMSKGDGDSMNALASIIRGEGVEKALAEILHPDQLAKHQAQRTADRHRNVEAQTNKDLAKLTNTLGLSESQRQAAYDLVYQKAGNRYDQFNERSPLTSLLTDGAEIDSSRKPFLLPNTAGEFVDEQAMHKANLARIEADIAPLADVLTSAQMNRLRNELLNETIVAIEHIQSGENTAKIKDGSTPVPPPTYNRNP